MLTRFFFILALISTAAAASSCPARGPCPSIPGCKVSEPLNVITYNTASYAPGSPFEANLAALLDNLILSANTATPSGGVRTVRAEKGDKPYKAYGYAQCYGPCGNCLVEARNTIKNAVPTTIGARFCTEKCFLRFESYPFA